MDKIHRFIGDLLDESSIGHLDMGLRVRMIDEMTDYLLDRIDRAAINALPEDKAIELADGLESGAIKKEDIAKFMQDAGLDLEKISLDTMMQFKKFYLEKGSVEEMEKEENR